MFAYSWLAERLPEFESANSDIVVHLISDSASPTDVGEDVELKIIFGDTGDGWAERDRLFGERLYPVALPAICKKIKNVDAEAARFSITDRTDVALALAASGHGIALARAPATDAMVKRYGLGRCLGPLEVPGRDNYHLTFRSRSDLSSAAQRFRTWLLDESKKEREQPRATRDEVSKPAFRDLARFSPDLFRQDTHPARSKSINTF